MSTADEPLARLCSRQICRRPAQATLTYVYADSTAVIGPLSVHAEPHAYDLCSPHAARLTPPRGWEVVRLETAPSTGDGAAASSATGQAAPRARAGTERPDTGPGVAGHERRRGLADLSTAPRTVGPSPAQVGEPLPVAHPAESPAEHPTEQRPGPVAPDERLGPVRRLTAVPSPAPAATAPLDAATGSATGSADGRDGRRPGAEVLDHRDRAGSVAADGASAVVPESGGDDAGDTLTDEIFAGEGAEIVDSRRRLAAQPEGMRRPHLRRGRRPRTGV